MIITIDSLSFLFVFRTGSGVQVTSDDTEIIHNPKEGGHFYLVTRNPTRLLVRSPSLDYAYTDVVVSDRARKVLTIPELEGDPGSTPHAHDDHGKAYDLSGLIFEHAFLHKVVAR